MEGSEVTAILQRINLWEGSDKGLVKMSVTLDEEGTKVREIKSERYCWQTK